MYGCGGLHAGACQPCVNCNEDEYEAQPCEGSSKRECAACTMLSVCEPGHFRAACGHGNKGDCQVLTLYIPSSLCIFWMQCSVYLALTKKEACANLLHNIKHHTNG
jgi:hypothetical protein